MDKEQNSTRYMLEKEQNFLRYMASALPGLITLGLALVSSRSHLIEFLKTQNSLTVVGVLFSTVFTSGGLGFLLAQIYFALPCSFPDYRSLFQDYKFPSDLDECKDDWEKLSKPGLCPCQRLRGRAKARNLAHYLWQIKVASAREYVQLNRDVSKQATRIAATGTAMVGIIVGCLLWIWLMRHFSYDKVSCFILVLVGFCFFGIPFLALWCARCRMLKDLRQTVTWGLKRELKLEEK